MTPPETDLYAHPRLQSTLHWFRNRGWEPFPFQLETSLHFLEGRHGLLNAPTGAGKTFALWLPALADWLERHPDRQAQPNEGLQIIWITPLRALAQDIVAAAQDACDRMGVPWRVEARTGDTSSAQKQRQRKTMPQGIVTTPESMHVLFSSKDHTALFKNLRAVIVDEWHELMGTKRGVQTELTLSRLRRLSPHVRVWGISATIGNLPQALETLLGTQAQQVDHTIVRARIKKHIEVHTVLPETVERFPWAGHLGVKLLSGILPVIHNSQSTLIFTNTRAQCEIWYQALLEADPDLAGVLAMHHGSLDAEIRNWVEDALHRGVLKAVVCTSSLDLGVDFRPVDTVIQIGGPKGVARFIQRAGRGGHQPGATSHVYFLPTHSLELIEAAALREAVHDEQVEDRLPVVLPYDVLVQYLVTIAVGEGFTAEEMWEEVRRTYAFQYLTEAEFAWALDFVVTGGSSLGAYDEYKKVERTETGRYEVTDTKTARQHRLSIGAIVGDVNLTVKFLKGTRLGTVEESSISQMNPGDTFWFAGRCLELVKVQGMDVLVKKSDAQTGKVPRWMGSRMMLSSQMAKRLREKIDNWLEGDRTDPEMNLLSPTLELQQRMSYLPYSHECLMEYIVSKEGHHLFIYPFEGRSVHEILAALLAWRISRVRPMTFSIAMNDYGFELLSDRAIPIEEAMAAGLFSAENLQEDLRLSINQTEMAQRRFREIATIAGLVFRGFPGKVVRSKHLQASTALLFKVFKEYDPENLLLRQAYTEVIDYQAGGDRLERAMHQLSRQHLRFTRPERFTPFCFPIMVDRLRERLSSEKLADRIARMQVMLERDADQAWVVDKKLKEK